MPEGHTLHRLALDLDAVFAGRRVTVSSPQGRMTDSAALLDRRRLVDASAHGKHLFVEFDRDLWLHVHLGLIGTMRLAEPAPPRGQVRLRLATSEVAADLRGPQVCELVDESGAASVMARLGPDPIRPDADPDLAWRRISRSGRSIAALLMDQAVLSGVGNVYRAEVLFRNRIQPHRPGNQLRRRSWLAIWTDLVELMPRGVVDRVIKTVRTEHLGVVLGDDHEGNGGGAQIYVYRRQGRPCRVCGSRIRTELVAGRNLFWCGNCQRRG